MTNGHPNALVTLLTTSAAAVIYKFAHQWGWLNFTQEDAILATGAVAAGFLFIGRRGPYQTLLAVKGWVVKGAAPKVPIVTVVAAPPVDAPPPA